MFNKLIAAISEKMESANIWAKAELKAYKHMAEYYAEKADQNGDAENEYALLKIAVKHRIEWMRDKYLDTTERTATNEWVLSLM